MVQARELSIALTAATVALPQQPVIRHLDVRCTVTADAQGLRCSQGSASAQLPELGNVRASFTATATPDARWQAGLTLRKSSVPLAALLKFSHAYGLSIPGTATGIADVELTATAQPTTNSLHAVVALQDLGYSEPSGRYAAEHWSTRLTAAWDSHSRRWDLHTDSRAGQLYIEPLFLDFAVLPLTAQLSATPSASGWAITSLRVQQGDAGTLTGNARLDTAYRPQRLSLQLEATSLGPLVTTDVQPFLIGSPWEGLTASGAARASMAWANGQLLSATFQPQQVSIKADRLGLSLEGMQGDAAWSASNAAPSTLRWTQGLVQKIALGSTAVRFLAQGNSFTVLDPWRIPLLDGALAIERFALRNLGLPTLEADFSGALEPIDLKTLCQSLGWPEFDGTLSGRLPGLRIRDNVWQIDGSLEASAFDGQIQISRLRAIEPFGVLPRITTDIRLRRLDLERVTRVFSFGRITGRLDGDIDGLRLLAWKPVAFDARLYSSPDDDQPHRISQRAIDNISSIGGGPTGVLSRGFLSLFEDFAYSRMGLGCVLRDGRCRMSGIEDTDNGDAYTIVQGRLLPRIDVVGFARNVSWNNLLQQLDAARRSSGPQTQAPTTPP